ncbi:hypothetical protein ACFOWT_08305 [Croceibacterium xixiisoli]|nr:hypothetical protein [Croceibacterium xixiisoli]
MTLADLRFVLLHPVFVREAAHCFGVAITFASLAVLAWAVAP